MPEAAIEGGERLARGEAVGITVEVFELPGTAIEDAIGIVYIDSDLARHQGGDLFERIVCEGDFWCLGGNS